MGMGPNGCEWIEWMGMGPNGWEWLRMDENGSEWTGILTFDL